MNGSTVFAILVLIVLIISVAGQWYLSRQDDELYRRSRALKRLRNRTGEELE